MDNEPRRIEQLPLEVRSRITSAVQILTLNKVALELVKNALDARATHIKLRLNLVKGSCCITDNGVGISAEEFSENGGLARLHHTSKSNEPQSYGQFGCFLASLATVSVLSISSCAKPGTVCTLVMKDGHRISVGRGSHFDSLLEDAKAGTRISVHNLFGNLPVRIKHQRQRYEHRRELEKDWYALRVDIAALALAPKHPFSIDIYDESMQKRMTYGPPYDDTGLYRMIAVMTCMKFMPYSGHGYWKTASLCTANTMIDGVICIQPQPTRRLQFITIGHTPVESSDHPVFEEINKIFVRSTFTGVSETVDKWPAFHLHLQFSDWQKHVSSDEVLNSAAAAVTTLVREFLTTNGFLTKTRRHTLRPEPESTKSTSTPFDAWSRIKSAKVMDHDRFVSGLPFFADAIGFAKTSCEVAIHPRTGMAMPDQSRDEPYLGRSTRNVGSTADLLRKNWSLPTPVERQIPQNADLTSIPITRTHLQNMQVRGQLDKKYILGTVEDLVIVIDQHAADERIQVEEFFSRIGDKHKVTLPKPILVELEVGEVGQCETLRPCLSTWGVDFGVKHEADSKAIISITALPEMIAERCRQEPQRLKNLLRAELWRENAKSYDAGVDWLGNITHCPQGILDMLMSRACRSAIMFNDVLRLEQAENLVRRLSRCHFPFQCAHGRPSMALLTKMNDVGYQEMDNFGRGWKAWERQRAH